MLYQIGMKSLFVKLLDGVTAHRNRIYNITLGYYIIIWYRTLTRYVCRDRCISERLSNKLIISFSRNDLAIAVLYFIYAQQLQGITLPAPAHFALPVAWRFAVQFHMHGMYLSRLLSGH